MAKGASLPKVVLNIELLTHDIVPAEMPGAIVNAPLRGGIATSVLPMRYVNPRILHQIHQFNESERLDKK
jgi:hypothetical protein